MRVPASTACPSAARLSRDAARGSGAVSGSRAGEGTGATPAHDTVRDASVVWFHLARRTSRPWWLNDAGWTAVHADCIVLYSERHNLARNLSTPWYRQVADEDGSQCSVWTAHEVDEHAAPRPPRWNGSVTSWILRPQPQASAYIRSLRTDGEALEACALRLSAEAQARSHTSTRSSPHVWGSCCSRPAERNASSSSPEGTGSACSTVLRTRRTSSTSPASRNGAPCLARLQRASAASPGRPIGPRAVQDPHRRSGASWRHRRSARSLVARCAHGRRGRRVSVVARAPRDARSATDCPGARSQSRPKSHHSAGGGDGPHRGSPRT